MLDEYDTPDELRDCSQFAPARSRAHRLAEYCPSMIEPGCQPRAADAGSGLDLEPLDDIPVPPSLDPIVIPYPLSRSRRGTTVRALARVFVVGLVAAGAAVMIVLRAEDQSKSISAPAAMTHVVAAAVRSEATERARVSDRPDAALEAPRRGVPTPTLSANQSSSADAGRTEPDPPGAPAAIISTGGASADGGAADQRQTVRRLDPVDVAVLLQRGHEVAANGDLVGARLLFQRAAEAGDSDAALALAGTYDPIVLEHLGERGLAPDVAAARFWYQKAQELGSKEAPQRLETLASRTN
jgi:hypothetical protein